MIGQILFVTLYNNQVAHLNRHGEYCHGHCILASRAAWAAAGALDTVTVTLGGTQFKFQLVSVPLLKSSNLLTAQVARLPTSSEPRSTRCHATPAAGPLAFDARGNDGHEYLFKFVISFVVGANNIQSFRCKTPSSAATEKAAETV